ncbi:succinylglutamate desuccinylase/aspartoacylase family protein [Halobaculum roseum]|uniref:Succinylglutamate desuccinylase/aspartoacylase family protein n=1 Tax=Halobaculum roseum TaxID=2175149 RepID=A0ABD5MLT7_9EURY|nr:succinylglutamate desuccinylase/aspartoacylase family protein [Halobaculum roseum]QZY03828.1 succinylglutamate desuccinylase/aspartoacylase family protein [Halobaculum roseum]
MADHAAERVTLARLPSGVAVETTVHTYTPERGGGGDAGDAGDGNDGDGGDYDGDGSDADDATGDDESPTVYVQAAQHGREINGAAVCRRLHDDLVAADLAGTVHVVPVADPLTFDTVSYTTPEAYDSVNPNMNRCWPGNADGSLHERMAASLWEYAGDADFIVDLHTGSRDMLTHTVYLRGDDASRGLAEAFGTDLLLAESAGEDADEEWASRNFGGKLRVAATREGIPSVTPELAHNKELVEDAIAVGVDGTKRALRHAGVLRDDGSVPAWDGTRARNHLGRVTATDSGLFRAAADLAIGDDVVEGKYVGDVYDPTTYEELQEATADRSGVVYSVAREATVTAGQTLVGIAIRLDDE